MRSRAWKGALVMVALVGSLLPGCKKKPAPAPPPPSETASLEARVVQLADSLNVLGDAYHQLATRVDSLEAVQAQILATRGRSTSRRRSDSGGGAGGGAAAKAAADSIAIDLDRQKMIFANYEVLRRQGFQGDTIPSFLSHKYGVDSSTVEAIAQRGQQEGW